VSEYGWKQLSQWDIPPKDAYINYMRVKTGLSEEICTYILVKRTDQGDKYAQYKYVKKEDVSQSILDKVGNI